MKEKGKGIGGFSTFLIIALVIGVYILISQLSQPQEINSTQFAAALAKGEIKSAVIIQDEAVPTGSVELHFKEKNVVKILYVSDVNAVQQTLLAAGITDIKVTEVPEESWFLTSLLPALVIAGALILVVILMNRPSGANAKAMNFGRNRAKMSNPSDKQVTFAQVAGLQEEKEEFNDGWRIFDRFSS